jgi:hypothetical protein
MRKIWSALVLSAVGAACLISQDRKQGVPPPSPTADWYKDADCRLVFFGTLEGLYEDGISNDVVDLIIGKESKVSNKVKHDFIFRCKLCHAVYEAFVLYRQRQVFNGSDVDTFKKGAVEPRIVQALKSDNARTRVYAMGELVQPWIKSKLLALKITDQEMVAFQRRLTQLVKEGYRLTHSHRATDPEYGDWGFYGACQACKAVETVSLMLDK